MKLKLNEHTLNAYVRRAIMEEIEENDWWIGGNPFDNSSDDYTPSPLKPESQTEEPEAAPQSSSQQGAQGGLDPENPVFGKNNDKYDVAKFQTWFNYPVKNGGMGGHLVVDGIPGPKTKAAYAQWLGQQTDKTGNPIAG